MTIMDGPVALRDVPSVLDESGYTEFISSFAPHTVQPAAWARAATCVDGELRATIGLLLLGEVVELSALGPRMRDAVDVLLRSGVCTTDGHLASLPGLVMLRFHGFWLIAQRPQMSPTLYVGDDSVALANRLTIPRGSRVLDLCSGPGIQALVCSLRAASVVASEINPVASALAGVNVGLNDVGDVVETRCGNLYDTVPGEWFDVVVANPPLLPIPDDLSYPFVGDGGPDGLRVVWQLLRGADKHLTSSGRVQLLGTTLSDGFLPLAFDALREWAGAAGMNAQFTTTHHAPAHASSRWTLGVGATIAAHAGTPTEDAVARLAAAYEAAGASHICFYFLTATRGEGHLRVVDLSPDIASHAWFV